MNKKLDELVILDFLLNWYIGAYKGRLMGEAFCKAFDIDDTALAYQPDPKKAKEHIWTWYCEKEKNS
jgi:hypothetical protein